MSSLVRSGLRRATHSLSGSDRAKCNAIGQRGISAATSHLSHTLGVVSKRKSPP